MWLLVAREPRPDAPDWPGRRLLAAVDAVAWPLLWVLLGIGGSACLWAYRVLGNVDADRHKKAQG